MNIFFWLLILFVGLKLTGFIGWSWWIVFTPIYIWLAVYIILLLVAASCANSHAKDTMRSKFRNR